MIMQGILQRSFLVLFAFHAAAQLPDYLPLQTGNRWMYRADRLGGASTVVEVTGQRKVGEHEYAVVRGWFGQNEVLLRRNESGRLVASAGEGVERLWVDFQSPAGQMFDTEMPPCPAKGAVVQRDGSGRYPIAEFANVPAIRYIPTFCADAGVTAEEYLPGVGLLKRTETTIAGPKTYELVYARVNNATVLSTPEISFGISLDKPVYEAGAPIAVRLALRNGTDFPLPLTFSSGQDFDLFIRDAKGEGVYTWSADKLFITLMREVNIEGEKLWAETVQVTLPKGRYTIEGVVTDTAKSYRAVASFEVQ
jgi:hypothetical protein